MPLTENYCVYKHTNKVNGKVYIGITKQDPKRRWQNGAGYARTYLGNAIAKYGWDGFTHEVLMTGLSKEEACAAEIRLIKEHNSNDTRYGYNICEGGQTGDNLMPQCGMNNNRAVSVKRIDPQSGAVVEYATIHEAATEMKINHRGISKACRGTARTYKGFIWEYADVEFTKPNKAPRGKYAHIKQQKKVSVVDVDGVKYVFTSVMAAAEHFSMRANTVSRYITGIRHDPSGRRWSACL